MPLAMLLHCHGRIRAQCATLRRLDAHLTAHGADASARTAAARLLHYFDVAAIHHHADEENDLFPALLESMAGSDAVCLRAMIDRLSAEHRALETTWRGLRGALERVAAGERVALDEPAIASLLDMYEGHIEFEESELFPMAERLLGDEALAHLGEAMRRRRGIAGSND
jgi:hemerythrin-like domain-containing protein